MPREFATAPGRTPPWTSFPRLGLAPHNYPLHNYRDADRHPPGNLRPSADGTVASGG